MLVNPSAGHLPLLEPKSDLRPLLGQKQLDQLKEAFRGLVQTELEKEGATAQTVLDETFIGRVETSPKFSEYTLDQDMKVALNKVAEEILRKEIETSPLKEDIEKELKTLKIQALEQELKKHPTNQAKRIEIVQKVKDDPELSEYLEKEKAVLLARASDETKGKVEDWTIKYADDLQLQNDLFFKEMDDADDKLDIEVLAKITKVINDGSNTGAFTNQETFYHSSMYQEYRYKATVGIDLEAAEDCEADQSYGAGTKSISLATQAIKELEQFVSDEPDPEIDKDLISDYIKDHFEDITKHFNQEYEIEMFYDMIKTCALCGLSLDQGINFLSQNSDSEPMQENRPTINIGVKTYTKVQETSGRGSMCGLYAMANGISYMDQTSRDEAYTNLQISDSDKADLEVLLKKQTHDAAKQYESKLGAFIIAKFRTLNRNGALIADMRAQAGEGHGGTDPIAAEEADPEGALRAESFLDYKILRMLLKRILPDVKLIVLSEHKPCDNNVPFKFDQDPVADVSDQDLANRILASIFNKVDGAYTYDLTEQPHSLGEHETHKAKYEDKWKRFLNGESEEAKSMLKEMSGKEYTYEGFLEQFRQDNGLIDDAMYEAYLNRRMESQALQAIYDKALKHHRAKWTAFKQTLEYRSNFAAFNQVVNDLYKQFSFEKVQELSGKAMEKAIVVSNPFGVHYSALKEVPKT